VGFADFKSVGGHHGCLRWVRLPCAPASACTRQWPDRTMPIPANTRWPKILGRIKVKCKGNKEGLAPFGQRTREFLCAWLSEYNNRADGNLWDIDGWGIVRLLQVLRAKTGLPCNPHTFRRTFACLLAKKGIDSLHIMRLGRWESIQMVERYTRSVTFEDSLKLYKAPLG
jgi:integrase